MQSKSRREFLTDVGAGMVVASVGSALAADLGFSSAYANQGAERLSFGNLEPLVGLMQETPAARLIPAVVERLRSGTALRDVVAAAALANARTFGGEDYVGFHTMMAIAPSYHMAQELPENRRALPVLKVLFRNATRIQEQGGTTREVLRPVTSEATPAGQVGGERLREAVRRASLDDAERRFAGMCATADDALNNVLYEVQDACEVHRVVLPYRAWDLMSIIGRDHAHALLRQSVRYCVRAEGHNHTRNTLGGVRTLVPRLIDQYQLFGRRAEPRQIDDGWVNDMSLTIFRATPERAADAVASAITDRVDPEAICQAIALAANQLILRDNGRPAAQASPNKPVGSVHGDSIGVHACDSANAWCNLARAANPRNKTVCLLLGAWQVAHDRVERGGDFLNWQPYPREGDRLRVRTVEPARLLGALEEAIRGREQARAAALVHRYGEEGLAPRALLDLLLRYAISEDGALHHEKFYRTTTEEFAVAREAHRWRYLIALARVTASGHGYAAPGHAEACRLLGV